MKNKLFLYSILTVICYVSSCDVIIEKDISSSSVILAFPADSLNTSMRMINFKWNNLSGATGYDMQIIQYNGKKPTNLLIDTSILKNTFTVKLDTGHFEWRIKAKNSWYETKFFSRRLFIVE